ncbi:ABC transporter permease [Pseudonocardia sp. MH-G8]|uniref:ABC transporter permease n=1 Tax=Pseudonocardia sp. MH-G8 TaxID=1854588 RepID=UPI001E58DB68|nr:ABC transporter permease [Pseudonocardia sp. MH-G8]
MRAVLATHVRNTKLLTRQRSLLVQVIVLPLAMLILSTMIFGGVGDTYPIAMVNQAQGPQAERLEQQVRTVGSDLGPYYEVVETDYARAKEQLDWGRLHMILIIPADYSTTNRLQVESFNINSDAAKNFRGRLEVVLNHTPSPDSALVLTEEMQRVRPHDTWRSSYLGGSSVLLALFFGATLIAANLFLLEREGRTRKEILLTPLHPAVSGLANVFTATVMAMALSLLPLGLSYWIAEFRVPLDRVLLTYLAMIPVMIACAGLGILLGHWLKVFRSAQPLLTVGAIATFFVAGGFTMVAFLPDIAQTFSFWWPFSRIFTWFSPYLHGFEGLDARHVVSVLVAAVLGLVLMFWAYVGELRLGASRR